MQLIKNTDSWVPPQGLWATRSAVGSGNRHWIWVMQLVCILLRMTQAELSMSQPYWEWLKQDYNEKSEMNKSTNLARKIFQCHHHSSPQHAHLRMSPEYTSSPWKAEPDVWQTGSPKSRKGTFSKPFPLPSMCQHPGPKITSGVSEPQMLKDSKRPDQKFQNLAHEKHGNWGCGTMMESGNQECLCHLSPGSSGSGWKVKLLAGKQIWDVTKIMKTATRQITAQEVIKGGTGFLEEKL